MQDMILIFISPFIGALICAGASAWPSWRLQMPEAEAIPIGDPDLELAAPKAIYYLLSAIIAVIITISALISDYWLQNILSALLGFALLYLSIVDIRLHLIPDFTSLGLVAIGLLGSFFLGDWNTLAWSTLAALTGYLLFWGIGWIYQKFTNQYGLGLGDAKLIAAGGAWCGLSALPMIIALAAGLTLLVALIQRIMGKKLHKKTALAFGPGLAFAIFTIYWLQQYGIGILS